MIIDKHLLNTVVSTFMILGMLSCKKNKDDPQPSIQPIVIVQTPVKNIYGIELYNQVLDTVNQTGKKFYNITTETYSNGIQFPIELAYVYYQPSDNSTKHVLGCAKNTTVKATNGIPSSNNNAIEFYKINSSNNTNIYDTITLSKSIASVFAAKATISTFNGESDAIASDGFGWDKGDILGFMLANGKRGLIKIKTAPTGSKDNAGNVSLGKILFDIKMEM